MTNWTAFRFLRPVAFAVLGAALAHAATVTKFGIDDLNTSTTDNIAFITTGTFLGSAQPGSSFADWTFNYVGAGVGQIPQTDLTVQNYHPWAVVDTPTTDLGGTDRARPPFNNAKKADAGGAVFEFIYPPSGEPMAGVDFLQVFRERFCNSTDDVTCTWSEFTYHFDNFGSTTSPFYVGNGGIGGTGVTKDTGGATFTNAKSRWMFDDSYDCENSGTPNAPGKNIGNSASCLGGTDGKVLKTQVQFQVFPATRADKVVTIYRGAQWGYMYSNVDTPEPGTTALAGIGVLIVVGRAMAARRGRRRYNRE